MGEHVYNWYSGGIVQSDLEFKVPVLNNKSTRFYTIFTTYMQ